MRRTPSSRRTFLKCSVGMAAAHAATPAHNAQEATGTSLPKVRFGSCAISRLIVGSNPFYGVSHFNGVLDQVMVEWNMPEQVCQTLLHCQQNGINAYQYAHHDRTMSDLALFRAKGGNMHLIAIDDPQSGVETAGSCGAIALYHYGEVTDSLFRAGQMDQVHEYTKRIRQKGVLVGVGTHKPEVVEYIEERGWDVDFYFLCAYNRTRSPEEMRKLFAAVPVPPWELYLESDPPHAYRVARQTPKTCFLFKILAAGRLTYSPEVIDKAFQQAFDNIKPQDCVVVGMYPRYKDQVTENCDLVRRLLANSSPALS